MTKAEIINIGRDLILKAGLLKKPTASQKEKFLKLLDTYEKELQEQSSRYTKVIMRFIHDIRSDILEGREINIDTIQDDEYIENYFVTKHEIDNFNNLINIELYETIFDELRKNKHDKKVVIQSVKKLDIQFRSHFKKISNTNISKNLLIFTTFERKLPMPALNRLHKFLLNYDEFSNESIIIDRLERAYQEFLRVTYDCCEECYKKHQINYKFIRYTHNNTTKKITMSLNLEDASKS
jgi:hypothetical protein